jgi:SAM-dependent methyltransferase
MTQGQENQSIPRFWAADNVFHQASAIDHQRDNTLPALKEAGIEAADFVVDVGCGAGHTLRLVERLNGTAQLVGIDPDDSAFGTYAADGSRIQFIRGMGENLPLPDSVASHVISRGAINWMHQATGLKEMVRVMRPDGTLVLMFCGIGHSVKKVFHPRRFGLRQLAGHLLELGVGLVLHGFGTQASRKTVFGRCTAHTSCARLRRQLRTLGCEITWLRQEGRYLGFPLIWWAVIKRIDRT